MIFATAVSRRASDPMEVERIVGKLLRLWDDDRVGEHGYLHSQAEEWFDEVVRATKELWSQ
jgi:hypothetical protein